MSVRAVTLWVCDECGYVRLVKSTGKHQTDNPADPRGKMLSHELKPVLFERVPTEENDLR